MTCYHDRMEAETYYSIWWNGLLVATAAVGGGAKRMLDWSFQGSVDLHKPWRIYMPISEVAPVIPRRICHTALQYDRWWAHWSAVVPSGYDCPSLHADRVASDAVLV